MNKDRGIIKWLPFNSIVEQQKVIDSIIFEKQKRKKPILTVEQVRELENKLFEAFYEQIKVTLKVYQNGYIVYITSLIKNIDTVYKKIKLENQTILFTQILDILM